MPNITNEYIEAGNCQHVFEISCCNPGYSTLISCALDWRDLESDSPDWLLRRFVCPYCHGRLDETEITGKLTSPRQIEVRLDLEKMTPGSLGSREAGRSAGRVMVFDENDKEANALYARVMALFKKASSGNARGLEEVVEELKGFTMPEYRRFGEPKDFVDKYDTFQGALLAGIASKIIPGEWEWYVSETPRMMDDEIDLVIKFKYIPQNNGFAADVKARRCKTGRLND